MTMMVHVDNKFLLALVSIIKPNTLNNLMYLVTSHLLAIQVPFIPTE